jgi:SpoVK/Ycf46/Vps4 family AAA+-type ATPase
VYIFERLKALEKTIILFDEIEEFCLDRENDKLAMESRMLTTAMLTQLNDLRRQQSCIFIVATNRIRSFDSAVTRPGRFDMLLFVGTPNLNARLKRLKSKLLGTRLSPDDIAGTMATTHSYLQSHWDHVRFFTFAENELLLNTIIQKKIQSGDVTEEYLDGVVRNIGRTSTIQGYVKDDYIASEALSRL